MKPKKIIMLTADERIDRRILLQAQSLGEAGFDVSIISKQDAEQHLAKSPQPQLSASKVYNIYRRLQKNNFVNKTFLRPLKTFFCFLFGSPAQFQLKIFWPLVSSYHADIYVAHDLPMLPTAALCAERNHAKLVYDSHELFAEQEFNFLERLMWRRVEKKYIGRCDVVMTINQSIAQVLKQRYSLSHVGVIQNAEKLVPSPSQARIFHQILNLPQKARIVLYQGNLAPKRNLEVLVKAMKHVNARHIHAIYLGSGPCLSTLKILTQKLQLQDRIHFIPAVAQEKLLSYTASADLGIIPYLPICMNNKLCTPNKLFEYISAGIPILSHNLIEITKLTQSFEIGMVEDFNFPKKIALVLDDIFTHEQKLLKLKTAMNEARKKINWQVEATELLALYTSIYS